MPADPLVLPEEKVAELLQEHRAHALSNCYAHREHDSHWRGVPVHDPVLVTLRRTTVTRRTSGRKGWLACGCRDPRRNTS